MSKMVGLKRKLEGEVEISEGAGDVFHEFLQNKPRHISSVHPEFVKDCELHEGAFGTPGSTICWTYTLGGKTQTVKQKLDVIDEKNKTMTFNCIDGEIMKEYKNMVATFQVIPKDKNTSIVKWTLDYEKLNSGIREPTAELDVLLELAKKIEAHHHSQKN